MKKNRLYRIGSALLAAAMVFTCVPQTGLYAFAEETENSETVEYVEIQPGEGENAFETPTEISGVEADQEAGGDLDTAVEDYPKEEENLGSAGDLKEDGNLENKDSGNSKDPENVDQTEGEGTTPEEGEVLDSADDSDVDEDAEQEKLGDSEEDMDSEETVEADEKPDSEEYPEYSGFVVNPFYEDILDVDELKAEIALLQEEASAGAGASLYSNREASEPFENAEAAADYLREQMVQRSGTVELYISGSVEIDKAYVKDVFERAIAYTPECKGWEGDALAWVYGAYSYSYQKTSGTGGNNWKITYTISFYTTFEQEKELTEEVNKALSSLNLDTATEYQKIRKIFDYICDHVNYDYSVDENGYDYGKHTAYNALCKGTAVCQGYAILFYRMCKDTGLSVRVITGIGNGGPHAWNIIKLGSKYYNVDSTWDGQDEETRHNYFLLNEDDFVDHIRDDEFKTAEFYKEYPMASTSYVDESDFEEKLEMENYEFEFTTLEGGTISSTADGKPKLLIFFSSDDSASCSTIQSLAEHGEEYGLTGVDIYAVEASKPGASKEDVASFRDTYGGDNITFAYDDAGNTNRSRLVSYVSRATGQVGSIAFSYPVIGYIDKDNKFQYLTMGTSNTSKIKANLAHYCNAEFAPDPDPEPDPDAPSLEAADVTVVAEEKGFTYNGTAHEPKVVVKVSEKELVEGTDYELSYKDNKNAGTATVTVTGKGDYSGTVSKTFEIQKRKLKIKANNLTIKVGDPVPEKYEYAFAEGSLAEGDKLVQEPSVTCGIKDSSEAKEYVIIPSGADAGSNYDISYENGKLTVVKEYAYFTVTFDVQGRGSAPAELKDVQEGSKVTKPEDPVAEGYRFAGWFKDAACTKAWNFDADTVQENLTLFAKWDRENISLTESNVSLLGTDFTYNGTEQKPEVVVTAQGDTLEEGTDYTLSYENNINAGTATVTVTGIGTCNGTVRKNFEIKKALLTVRARNKTIQMNDPLPNPGEYEYVVDGLKANDELVTKPVFTCTITSTAKVGTYAIVPSGADAGENYTITFVNGKLEVVSEYTSCTVTFDVQGHGSVWEGSVDVSIGNTIDRPTEPTAAGYRFDGWYRDAACTKAWDFETDTVQENMTLYAKWLMISSSDDKDSLAIQEIADVYYTGKPCKPAVSVYDGDTLLKAGRDYQIKYYNNTNTNKDGVKKAGNGAGTSFKQELPYVEIIGKGNYTETVKVNFNILEASIGDGSETPAAGVKLTVKDQLVTATKGSLKPFSSIKYVKAMRQDTDYTVSLTAVNAKDASGKRVTGELIGAVIPADCSGEFRLTVEGQGNYTGSINKTIYVADKEHLMKNAIITLGANQKNVEYKGELVTLTAAEESLADTFTVKCGGDILNLNQYTVSYRNNDRVGKAELIITGAGEYIGSKTATFSITGTTLSTKTVNIGGIEDKMYSGRAWTQNNVALTCAGKSLEYGRDYTISYSKNVNKGTATMIFKGIEKAGYSGSFKKTFKITAADISKVEQVGGQLVFAYCKAGVKPVDEIVLMDQNGMTLKNGRDYTLKYADNKAVGNATVIVKGKGNYTSERKVPFQIVKADLKGLTIKTTPAAFKSNKPESYEYRPAVKLMDGNTALRADKDYEIKYLNNTQADCQAYVSGNIVWSGTLTTGSGMPMVVITEKEGSPYQLTGEIIIPLPVYQTQLKKTDLNVELGDTKYTGSQVRPSVRVTYGGKLLVEDEDYTLSYGANIKSGKNKGSVTISGLAPKYGGSVTVKFDIVQKAIAY